MATKTIAVRLDINLVEQLRKKATIDARTLRKTIELLIAKSLQEAKWNKSLPCLLPFQCLAVFQYQDSTHRQKMGQNASKSVQWQIVNVTCMAGAAFCVVFHIEIVSALVRNWIPLLTKMPRDNESRNLLQLRGRHRHEKLCYLVLTTRSSRKPPSPVRCSSDSGKKILRCCRCSVCR